MRRAIAALAGLCLLTSPVWANECGEGHLRDGSVQGDPMRGVPLCVDPLTVQKFAGDFVYDPSLEEWRIILVLPTEDGGWRSYSLPVALFNDAADRFAGGRQ